MSSLKKKELSKLPEKDLRERMLQLKKDLMKENAHIAIGTVPKSPGSVRQIKKTLAQINTIVRQKTKGGINV